MLFTSFLKLCDRGLNPNLVITELPCTDSVSYYSRIYGVKGADRMTTLVQSDLCSMASGFCAHCTYLTVKNLGFSKLQFFPMHTELMQQHTMVAEVRECKRLNGLQ